MQSKQTAKSTFLAGFLGPALPVGCHQQQTRLICTSALAIATRLLLAARQLRWIVLQSMAQPNGASNIGTRLLHGPCCLPGNIQAVGRLPSALQARQQMKRLKIIAEVLLASRPVHLESSVAKALAANQDLAPCPGAQDRKAAGSREVLPASRWAP